MAVPSDREVDAGVQGMNTRSVRVEPGTRVYDEDIRNNAQLENRDLSGEVSWRERCDEEKEEEEGVTEKTGLLLAALPLGDKGHLDAAERKKESRALVNERRRRNLANYCILVFSRGIGSMSWTGTPLAALTEYLCHGEAYGLGVISACQGLAQLIAAFPLGFIGDRRRTWRATMMRCAAVVQFLVVVIAVGTVLNMSREQHEGKMNLVLISLTAALSLHGFVTACMQSVGQSILADSLVTLNRQSGLTKVQISRQFGNSLGPLIALAIFRSHGNIWSVSAMKATVEVGATLLVPCCVALCFFDARIDHERISGHQEEEVQKQTAKQQRQVLPPPSARGVADAGDTAPAVEEEDNDGEDDDTEAVWAQRSATTATDDAAAAEGTSMTSPLLGTERVDDDVENGDGSLHARNAVLRFFDDFFCEKNVPLLLFLSDFVTSLATGMTVKFFPLWLKDEVGLTPTMSLITESLTYLSMAFFSSIALRLSKRFNRVRIALSLSLSLSSSTCYDDAMYAATRQRPHKCTDRIVFRLSLTCLCNSVLTYSRRCQQ